MVPFIQEDARIQRGGIEDGLQPAAVAWGDHRVELFGARHEAGGRIHMGPVFTEATVDEAAEYGAEGSAADGEGRRVPAAEAHHLLPQDRLQRGGPVRRRGLGILEERGQERLRSSGARGRCRSSEGGGRIRTCQRVRERLKDLHFLSQRMKTPKKYFQAATHKNCD